MIPPCARHAQPDPLHGKERCDKDVREPAFRYALAIGAWLLATVFTLALAPVHDRSVVTPALVAVTVSSWYGGLRSGLLTTGLTALTTLIVLHNTQLSAGRLVLMLVVYLAAASCVTLVVGIQQWSLEQAQRARQAAETALKERDALLAFLSHDLRTPLTTIKGCAQLARRTLAGLRHPTAEQIDADLQAIEVSATQLAGMVEELVEPARWQAGRSPEPCCQPIDLVELVRAKVTAQQAAAPMHELQLVTANESLLGCWDGSTLGRVIDNLLANAVKYSPAGGSITVTIRGCTGEVCKTTSREGTGRSGWVEVTVTDCGIGIPAADLPHLFTPFRRGSNAVGRFSGSGLGLASARHIVEQNGGTLTVESREGAGSTFTLRLPRG